MAISQPIQYHRRKPRSRGRSRRGRLWVILFFCGLRAGDALMYFGCPAAGRSRVQGALVIGALWTTAALAGLWARKSWCRFALNILIVLSTLADTIFIPALFQLPVNYRVLIFVLAAFAVNGAVVWAVISLPVIRRLTSRAYSS